MCAYFCASEVLSETVELRVYINHSLEEVKKDSVQNTDEIRFKVPSKQIS